MLNKIKNEHFAYCAMSYKTFNFCPKKIHKIAIEFGEHFLEDSRILGVIFKENLQ